MVDGVASHPPFIGMICVENEWLGHFHIPIHLTVLVDISPKAWWPPNLGSATGSYEQCCYSHHASFCRLKGVSIIIIRAAAVKSSLHAVERA